MLTISLSELQAVRPVSGNFPTGTGVDRFSMFVDEARRMDIQPAIGSDLLYKIDNDSTSPLTYAALLDGGDYEHNGDRYLFPGLKKALCFFVYARLVKSNQVNVTAYGVTIKTNENSEPVEEKTIQRISNDAYNTAIAYLQDCMTYIQRMLPTQEVKGISEHKKTRFSSIGD